MLLPLSFANADGLVTTYVYTDGELTSIANNSGSSSFTYNNGLIESVIDGAAKTVYYTYDSAGDLTTVTNLDGDALTYVYDSDHNLTV